MNTVIEVELDDRGVPTGIGKRPSKRIVVILIITIATVWSITVYMSAAALLGACK